MELKYDKDHIDIILKELSDGNGRVRACKAAGIGYDAFMDWMNKPEFSESVKKAELKGNDKIKDLAKRGIIEKMQTQWQAAAWWLERNYPDEFRNRSEVQLDQKHIEAITKAFEGIDDTDEAVQSKP